MTTLKAQMLADRDTVFFNTDDFARAITYKVHSTSVETTGKGILTQDMKPSPTEYGDAEMVTWIIPSTLCADPEIYDTITEGTTTYRVKFRQDGTIVGTWKLMCEADRRQKPGNVR